MKVPAMVLVRKKSSCSYRLLLLVLLVTALLAITVALALSQQELMASVDFASGSRYRKAELSVSWGEFKAGHGHGGREIAQQKHFPAEAEASSRCKLPSCMSDVELHRLRSRIDRENLTERFPSIVVLGFSEAAVDVVFQLLELHPSLVGGEGKNRFFSGDYSASKIESHLRSLPRPKGGESVVQKGADYITTPVAASRIIDAANNVRVDPSKMKFVVALSDPTDDILAKYAEKRLNLVQQGRPYPTNEIPPDSRPKNPTKNCYVPHIAAWLQEFPQEQMCYVDSESLTREPHRELNRLEQCLELPPFFMLQSIVPQPDTRGHCLRTSRKTVCLHNSTSSVDHSVAHILRGLDIEMDSLFRFCYKQLPALTGRDLSKWGIF